MLKIAVFGAGTWGIALARLLAAHGRDVTVWSAIPAELKALATTRRHPNLPGMELPKTMHYTADIADVCTGRDLLVVLESMKMENYVYSPVAGTVTKIFVGPAAGVEAGETLVTLDINGASKPEQEEGEAK